MNPKLKWPWLVLAFGMAWAVLIRVPLMVHASDHLDSDLAVDGLTLIDAVEGHWRWHYPGTPHMGTLPVLLSYPQSLIFGANPITLVSGGTVAWLLVLGATFGLAWRAFGPSVAGWSLIPLVFASVGTVWLSGRITGGHLLTLTWHLLAIVGFLSCVQHGGRWRPLGLGGWCGLGLYLDPLFLFSMAGMVLAAPAVVWTRKQKASTSSELAITETPSQEHDLPTTTNPPVALRPLTMLALSGVGLLIGLLPAILGRWLEPYDAYDQQFAIVTDAGVLTEHARILGLECLPRLISGHVLPDFLDEPARLSSLGRPIRMPGSPSGFVDRATTIIGLAGFAFGLFGLLLLKAGDSSNQPLASMATRWALLGASVFTVAGFLVNKNIYNSDNYRYLILLIPVQAIGFGLVWSRLSQSGVWGRRAAVFGGFMLAVVLSTDLGLWYHRLEWLGGSQQTPTVRSDPSHRVLDRAEVVGATHLFGGYWQVYRASFLSGGSLTGVADPRYPNRFADWSRGLGPNQGKVLVLIRSPAWSALWEAAWKRDGRDPQTADDVDLVTMPARTGPSLRSNRN